MIGEEKGSVVLVQLSKRNLLRVEAVQALDNVDRSTLLKEFIENGLQERVVKFYREGKINSVQGAEILEISLQDFLELLENKGVPFNWNTGNTVEYAKVNYSQ